jgi:lysophospholipase L1-like esterase
MAPVTRWLLLPVPVLLAALGLELGLRAVHDRARARLRARDPARSICTRPAADPALVYEVTPGRCGANSRGFQDEEHAVPRPPGMRRLVVIGDSVAQGVGVGRANAFPEQLERILDAGSAEPAVEVVLLARAGYSTGQELRVLETEASRYQPDAVLWSYVLNDPAHPVFHNPNGELGLYHYAPRSRLAHLVATGLFLLREGWQERGCRAEYHARLHCVYRDRIAADLERIGAWSRAQGVPVVFAIHPAFEKGGRFEAYSLANVHADLARMARHAGLHPVDLLEAYAGHDPETLKLKDPPGWHDAWHPNTEGHRLAAEALAARLRGYLSRPPVPPLRPPVPGTGNGP